MPGIESMLIDRNIGGDGLLTSSTAGDPFRAVMTDTMRVIDELELPLDTGERQAIEALKQAGHTAARNVLMEWPGSRSSWADM